MSTRKDAIKSNPNPAKRKVATKPSTRREESGDRSNVKKTEAPVKARTKPTSTTNLASKKVDSTGVKTKVTSKLGNTQSTPNAKQVSTSSKTTVKPKVPVTLPSNRVLKTQYFPSKSLYSNALKVKESANNQETEKVKKIGEGSTRVKGTTKKVVKNISEPKIRNKPIRVAHETATNNVEHKKQIVDISPDSSSMSERPRTATLRKGSIVNTNIVGPDVPKQLVAQPTIKEVLKPKPPSPKSEASDDCNYEDDFESYESDFEKCSSSSSAGLDDVSGEETSSSSSGSNNSSSGSSNSSSISSNSSSVSRNQPKEPSATKKRVNSAGTDEERKLDSGNFDMSETKHKQVLDNIKESIEKENAKLESAQRINPASLSDEGFEDQKSLQFINFLDAKKKYKQRKRLETKRKRGEEILNMIRLDTYSFTLFELDPVPYEVFIKNYGQSNTMQIGTQTGDDNIDEEVQTEAISTVTKWTQYPVCFSKINADDPDYWKIYKSDYKGVGGDTLNTEKTNNKLYNENSLQKFISSAGNLILKIQEESFMESNRKIQQNTRDIPFSENYILFNTATDMFKNCSVKCLTFNSEGSKVLTVHSSKNQNAETGRSILCIWSISNSEEPTAFFVSYGDISCCSFGMESSDFLYTGSNDGTVSVWDLKKKIYNEDSLLKRTAVHSTHINSGHTCKVVSLHPFTSYTDKNVYFQANQTNEICSLDEEGNIIIWNVIAKYTTNGFSLSNCSTWNDVVLLKNTKISLKQIYVDLENLQCTDFVVNTTDSNYVLVSTNYGFIIHYLIKGGRSNVKKFVPESPSVVNCLEVCPFSPNYFLAGFDDGNINLYSRLVESPIMVLSDKDDTLKNNGIQILQWSRYKPFVIYAKDVNNTIHVWDLNESDIFPTYSVPFTQNITCMKLSPLAMDNEGKAYMLIGTEDGNLYLHLLNSQHGPQKHDTYKEHVNTFLKYVNRL